MARKSLGERSPEFQGLVDKFRKEREDRPVREEPRQPGGRSVAEFVDLTTEVAENYTGNSYLKTARLK